ARKVASGGSNDQIPHTWRSPSKTWDQGTFLTRARVTGRMMAIAMPDATQPARATAPREPELDRAMLVLCRAQDRAAFRAFVVRYQRMVFALLSRMLGRGPHVEDLA